MKAIGYKTSHPITHPEALLDIELVKPVATGRDILVKVEAISVNPVDTKIRSSVSPAENEVKVLGWDAVGTVDAVGEQVSMFKCGDRVWYAGAVNRAGCNAEFHLVDERIVSLAPTTLTSLEAAALPLTSITAWELLFDRFNLTAKSTGTLLILGGAGGVGSIMIQLAKKLTQLTVIATASRTETKTWATSLGADYVIDHHKNLADELTAIGVSSVNYIASLTHTAQHLENIIKIISPQGKLGVIDSPATLDIVPFKNKSVSVHWEFMFTRSLFTTEDMLEQHNILSNVAQLVDDGTLKTTMKNNFATINAGNLMQAHALLESGNSIGKIVLNGF